jgi:nitrite reductase/ring-hydroxylating ferredoxin subunit
LAGSLAQEFPDESAGNGDGMGQQDTDLAQSSLGLMEHAELPEDGRTIVVNPLAGQAIVGVKRVHAAQGKFDSPSGGRQTAPIAEMSAANDDFHEDGVVCDVLTLDGYLEVGQGVHQLLVELPNSIAARVVLAPGLIVVARTFTEGAENAFEIVVVLEADVLLDEGDASRPPVYRMGCVCHLRQPNNITGERYDRPVKENQSTQSEIERRQFLLGALAVTGMPPLCCTSRELPPDSMVFDPGKVTVDLSRVPELRRAGAAYSVVDEGRKVNLILIHVRRGVYVALDRSCTHGGAQCTFNPKRQTLQCTSLNHAEYDLHGTLLHGRTHGNLRTYETKASGETVEIRLERNA